MTNPYPEPATPLPWNEDTELHRSGDWPYIVHAANAFPHLVAALEEVEPFVALNGDLADEGDNALLLRICNALAIARGEKP
jgi:hypothetical protein